MSDFLLKFIEFPPEQEEESWVEEDEAAWSISINFSPGRYYYSPPLHRAVHPTLLLLLAPRAPRYRLEPATSLADPQADVEPDIKRCSKKRGRWTQWNLWNWHNNHLHIRISEYLYNWIWSIVCPHRLYDTEIVQRSSQYRMALLSMQLFFKKWLWSISESWWNWEAVHPRLSMPGCHPAGLKHFRTNNAVAQSDKTRCRLFHQPPHHHRLLGSSANKRRPCYGKNWKSWRGYKSYWKIDCQGNQNNKSGVRENKSEKLHRTNPNRRRRNRNPLKHKFWSSKMSHKLGN